MGFCPDAFPLSSAELGSAPAAVFSQFSWPPAAIIQVSKCRSRAGCSARAGLSFSWDLSYLARTTQVLEKGFDGQYVSLA